MSKNRAFINFLFRISGVIAALLFTALVLLIAKANPWEAFSNIFLGAVSTPIKIADSFVAWVPLILATCGLVITFTTGLWNIGIEGQISLGAIMTTWALRLLQDSGLPPVVIILAGFLAGIAGGIVWALLAGMLKFYGGVSEIFAGLGLNFIATALTLWLIFGPWKRAGVASMSGTEPFDMSIWLPTLTGYRLSIWSLILAVVSVLIVYFILKHTVVGLRLKAVGKNYKAAIQMGISPSKYMLLSFVLCGVFAGLTGAVQVLGVYHRLIPSISSGYGFLGLLVAMLVDYQIVWAVPMALLFAALNIGGIQLPIMMKIDSTLSGVMQSSLVLFFMLMDGVRKKILKKEEEQSNE
ncbi:ABC transporter permease [Pelolinea submarina]|uniref:Nucleoside ABC transporter membrane protein n=1 Tax=Pelolinea submarina TaxID=913107 RepID=A0A347ZUI1_9CHLR|nr:ABC transporter permease [Pelolinea submarina]REG10451.1 nucleoside ABC transporter membrane protein [Pelolinea submarina]BBB48962.1 simple sugar transport system permease protein [Pelolinea submarina]